MTEKEFHEESAELAAQFMGMISLLKEASKNDNVSDNDIVSLAFFSLMEGGPFNKGGILLEDMYALHIRWRDFGEKDEKTN